MKLPANSFQKSLVVFGGCELLLSLGCLICGAIVVDLGNNMEELLADPDNTKKDEIDTIEGIVKSVGGFIIASALLTALCGGVSVSMGFLAKTSKGCTGAGLVIVHTVALILALIGTSYPAYFAAILGAIKSECKECDKDDYECQRPDFTRTYSCYYTPEFNKLHDACAAGAAFSAFCVVVLLVGSILSCAGCCCGNDRVVPPPAPTVIVVGAGGAMAAAPGVAVGVPVAQGPGQEMQQFGKLPQESPGFQQPLPPVQPQGFQQPQQGYPQPQQGFQQQGWNQPAAGFQQPQPAFQQPPQQAYPQPQPAFQQGGAPPQPAFQQAQQGAPPQQQWNTGM